jgi:PAS domain S-box-containing protein
MDCELRELRESENSRFPSGIAANSADGRELADFASESVIVFDIEGVIRYWNPASEALYGWPATAAIGRRIAEFFADRERDAKHWLALLREGIWRGPVRRNTAAGLQITLSVRQTVRYAENGLPSDVVEYGRSADVDAQFRQLHADHAHAARISTLGELATTIAHEVKQPLASIITNAETSLRWLMRDDVNVPKIKQLTTRIISSTHRANDIIQRVRSLAVRGESERMALDLNEVTEEALFFVRPEIEAKQIDLSIDAAQALPKVLGDRVQLQQVIVNLLINSIQALSLAEWRDRHIRVSIEPGEGDALVFSVRDSGPGIAAKDLDHVFDSFFTTKKGGMGIGLAICQSIVSAHGGRMAASNLPEGGAHFQFAIPTAPA